MTQLQLSTGVLIYHSDKKLHLFGEQMEINNCLKKIEEEFQVNLF